MSGELEVYKNRTNVIQVNLGIDVSADIIESQIRAGDDVTSELIATWDVSFLTDGTDGKLVLRIDDSSLLNVTVKKGFMDLKRITGGEPYAVFADPLKVKFENQVTE